MLLAELHASMNHETPTGWYIIAGIVLVLVFFLALALLGMWFNDRKSRRLHEEQMLALERGLLPPDWAAKLAQSGFRKGWLWLAIGLPIFIACALGVGTFLLVDANRYGGHNLTGIIITIWLVGGTVGLAAVILGGLGLMVDQRRHLPREPFVGPPQARAASSPGTVERDSGSERFWKQERP
jgi:hypothetical protein